MTASDIASIMVTYPALTDAARRASMTFPVNGLDRPFTQLMMRVRRWFGEGLP
jgi:hypothetical protein